jgi:hypothetical protein
VKKIFYLGILLLGLVNLVSAQGVPKELWGTWTVRRVVPATAVSCWNEKQAKKLVGTELEYSADLFRWDKIVTNHPTAEVTTVSAEQFAKDNSGMGANSSQVTFEQIGIAAKEATQVLIAHPRANVTGTTIEIPGDAVLIKDQNTVIFSVCNVYFEAVRKK